MSHVAGHSFAMHEIKGQCCGQAWQRGLGLSVAVSNTVDRGAGAGQFPSTGNETDIVPSQEADRQNGGTDTRRKNDTQ